MVYLGNSWWYFVSLWLDPSPFRNKCLPRLRKDSQKSQLFPQSMSASSRLWTPQKQLFPIMVAYMNKWTRWSVKALPYFIIWPNSKNPTKLTLVSSKIQKECTVRNICLLVCVVCACRSLWKAERKLGWSYRVTGSCEAPEVEDRN